jgi:hypothetical protein
MIAKSRRCSNVRPSQALESLASSSSVKTRDHLGVDRGWLGLGHRVRQILVIGPPLEELLERSVLVVAVAVGVPVQQPDHPLLDVGPADLVPVRVLGLGAQVLRGEPLGRLGVGPHGLVRLAFGSQMERERGDRRLEGAGVEVLGLTGAMTAHALGKRGASVFGDRKVFLCSSGVHRFRLDRLEEFPQVRD